MKDTYKMLAGKPQVKKLCDRSRHRWEGNISTDNNRFELDSVG